MPRIENWSVNWRSNDPYRAPECAGVAICGLVYGHPQQPDGKSVKTSPIVAAKGRLVWTEHTVYELGKIDRKYRKWLRENRPDWDWRNPVTAPPPTKEMEQRRDVEGK
jgi:hypothetical protein